MIRIVLDAVKLLISPDARNLYSEITAAFNRTPEWRKDRVVIEVQLTRDDERVAQEISKLIAGKMAEDGYDDDQIMAFRICFEELSCNALLHGASSNEDEISIRVEYAPGGLFMSFSNAEGDTFDLERQYRIAADTSAAEGDTADPDAPGGNGLRLVSRFAHKVSFASSPTTISVEIGKGYSRVSRTDSGVLKILRPLGAIDQSNNQHFELALLDAVAADGVQGIVVDMGAVSYISSVGLRSLMKLVKSAAGSGVQVAVCELTEPVREIFQISRFDRILRCFASMEEAQGHFDGLGCAGAERSEIDLT